MQGSQCPIKRYRKQESQPLAGMEIDVYSKYMSTRIKLLITSSLWASQPPSQITHCYKNRPVSKTSRWPVENGQNVEIIICESSVFEMEEKTGQIGI